MSNGRLAREIVPVTIPQGKGAPVVFDTDEHPRASTTLEGLRMLRTFVKADGTVTAGNASGVNDGSGSYPRDQGRSRKVRFEADRESAWRRHRWRCTTHHGLRTSSGLQKADASVGSYARRFRHDRDE